MDENATYVASILYNLKPATQYAIYVQTYTVARAKSDAISSIQYLTTKPAGEYWNTAASTELLQWVLKYCSEYWNTAASTEILLQVLKYCSEYWNTLLSTVKFEYLKDEYWMLDAVETVSWCMVILEIFTGKCYRLIPLYLECSWQPRHSASGSALDCRSTGWAINLAPGAWFIPIFISLAQIIPYSAWQCGIPV